MTSFPLSDNLRDARRSRAEGYAGTLNDRRLTWFPPSRLLTVPAAIVGAFAALTAVSALAAPMIGADVEYYHDYEAALVAQMLGRTYPVVWLTVGVTVVAAFLAVFAAGGAAATRRSRVAPFVAGVGGVLATALGAYLCTHSLDLAAYAYEHLEGVRILLPKGHSFPAGDYAKPWPYLAEPGVGAWMCLVAGVSCLVSTALATVNAIVAAPQGRWYRAGSLTRGDAPAR